jgi:uncharacterized protein involved in exopolysaccharide biosynthesis
MRQRVAGRREYRCAGALRQPELLSEKLEVYRAQLGVREVEVRSQLEHLDRQLAELERREARLLDLYLEEGRQVPALKERLADLRQQKAGLTGC